MERIVNMGKAIYSKTVLDEMESYWSTMSKEEREKVLTQTNVGAVDIPRYLSQNLSTMPTLISNKISGWIRSEYLSPSHAFYKYEPRIKRSFLTVDQAYDKAQKLHIDRVLSEEVFKNLTQQLNDTDIYPFTMKLVSVGIKIADNKKSKIRKLFESLRRR